MSSEPDVRESNEEMIYLYTFCGVVSLNFGVATNVLTKEYFVGRPPSWDAQVEFDVQTGRRDKSPARRFTAECVCLKVLYILQ